jgi:mRNA interferase RelE/StbE
MQPWLISREASIASSAEFEIAETATFLKRIELPNYRRYYSKLVESVYPKLRSNPYFGPNIKRLKGDLRAVFRYRIGDYRVFYAIDPKEKRVFILEIQNRKDAYRKK